MLWSCLLHHNFFLPNDAVHRIFFEDKEKHVSWVGVPFSCSLSTCEIQVLTCNRPNRKNSCCSPRPAFILKIYGTIWGASSADGSSMLSLNETDLRKHAKKSRFFSKMAPINGGQSARENKMIWDKELTQFSDCSPLWTPIAFLGCFLPVEFLFQRSLTTMVFNDPFYDRWTIDLNDPFLWSLNDRLERSPNAIIEWWFSTIPVCNRWSLSPILFWHCLPIISNDHYQRSLHTMVLTYCLSIRSSCWLTATASFLER